MAEKSYILTCSHPIWRKPAGIESWIVQKCLMLTRILLLMCGLFITSKERSGSVLHSCIYYLQACHWNVFFHYCKSYQHCSQPSLPSWRCSSFLYRRFQFRDGLSMGWIVGYHLGRVPKPTSTGSTQAREWAYGGWLQKMQVAHVWSDVVKFLNIRRHIYFLPGVSDLPARPLDGGCCWRSGAMLVAEGCI